ncbi:MAG: hypothetical protein PUH54_01360 [Oscillospiraceae bacterium]|nr:hypothetical protein [Oscillospiraceae bacterium]
MYDAIFLTTPSRLFSDITDAYRRARALYDYINRFCKKNNIHDTNLEIGVSNINPRKAQYVYQTNGVGRPQKVLAGNLKKCFVRPHLHMIVSGKFAAQISDLIIKYFTKRYKSSKSKNHRVKIWKEYIFNNEVERVRKYITIQSLHYLTLKSQNSEINTKTKEKRIINVKVKNQAHINKKTVSQANYNQNYILLCNLRHQWLLLQSLKRIADYIVNYDIYDTLTKLQIQIQNYGNMINANIDVAHLYNSDIINITMEIERMRQITVAEKQKFDYFCS